MKLKLLFSFGILLLAAFLNSFEVTMLKSRLDYYTNESKGALLVNVDAESNSDSVFCSIKFKETLLLENFPLNVDEINVIPFYVEYLEVGKNELSVIFTASDQEIILAAEIIKRAHTRNAVKIDRFTGGLIVAELPFFPFGFYCYSPVQPELPEQEVVKGFNLISPYQQIKTKTFADRKKYMDRCAELGMKVHYNLCSVAGGGGAGSARRKLSDKRLEKLLINEVKAFKDHPALLAWYISDEPVLQNMPTEKLEKVYAQIKEIDPYHPISIVFMKPGKAKQYENAMDIVMADPYPIPKGSVKTVANVTKRLVDKFRYEKPVWIVPQAFGGNEWWEREPTRQELRVMTQLAIANGATGIQYFIRHGLNGFPKSTTTWAECGAMALETAELTPFLLNDKWKKLECDSPRLEIQTWQKDDQLTILVINEENSPTAFTISFPDISSLKKLNLPFENRIVEISDNSFSDVISAYGSNVYQTELPEQKSLISDSNLLLDPSFENNTSAGVPNYCYANAGSDKGSTYFIDSKISFDSEHSLRLVTPTYGKGPLLKFFKVKLEYNKTYKFSIWAKAASPLPQPEKKRSFFEKLFYPDRETEKKDFTFKLHIGSDKAFFELTNKWEKYELEFLQNGAEGKKYNGYPKLELIGNGTAWFDLMQVVKEDISNEQN